MSKQRKSLPRAKRWCYTLNNPQAEPVISDNVVYHVFGREKGENNTPHLQGFIIFDKQLLLTQVRQIIPQAYWEVARGKNKQAADYCKKDGDYVEQGELPLDKSDVGGLGTKRKYEEFKQLAKEGRFEEIDPSLFTRHYRTMKQIRTDYMKSIGDLPSAEKHGVWIYGQSGIGKSHKAREDYPNAYFKLANKWWDGYQEEQFVIIDDLEPSHSVLGYHLKIWADRYEFNAETKGGMLRVRPKKIIVTSQYSIEEIWTDPATVEAITRRFEIIYLN